MAQAPGAKLCFITISKRTIEMKWIGRNDNGLCLKYDITSFWWAHALSLRIKSSVFDICVPASRNETKNKRKCKRPYRWFVLYNRYKKSLIFAWWLLIFLQYWNFSNLFMQNEPLTNESWNQKSFWMLWRHSQEKNSLLVIISLLFKLENTVLWCHF